LFEIKSRDKDFARAIRRRYVSGHAIDNHG
jgi:hypothetical protein